jgi:DNA-binding response OmpR family regulator
MKVLVIEDNPEIAANLHHYLECRGFVVDVAMSGPAGLHLALAEQWDAILLDVMLPGMSGLALCRKLREESYRDTPVLMLTAKDALDDMIEGFQHGADDYLVKPFSLKELGARLDALIKRYRGLVARRELRHADVRFDLVTQTVERAGRVIELRPKCRQLLRLLMESPGRMRGRAELEAEIWGESLPGSHTLRVHVHMLRKALTQPGEIDLIATAHGTGYRLINGVHDEV